jgi:hypothetical protein
MRLGLALTFAWTCVAATGCGAGAPPTTFQAINNNVFKNSCANFSVCHSKQGARDAGNLDLSQDPYTALFNVDCDNAQAKAEGKKRVLPGDPFNSFMMIKLTLPESSTDDGGYQESMPLGNPHLPAFDLAGIRAWILAGALNN